MSTDILWQVFCILTEPVLYTFVSINQWNSKEASLFCGFMDINVYGTCSIKIQKTRPQDIRGNRYFLLCRQHMSSDNCAKGQIPYISNCCMLCYLHLRQLCTIILKRRVCDLYFKVKCWFRFTFSFCVCLFRFRFLCVSLLQLGPFCSCVDLVSSVLNREIGQEE